MSGYYVLALDGGKVRRHEAQSLPDAQKLMRKHGPSAAIFTGQKCFGTLPGISNAARDTLILAARGGGMGDCAFCDDDAVTMVDGDPVCAKHRQGAPEHEPDDDEPATTAAAQAPAPASAPPPPPQPARAADPSTRPTAPPEGRCDIHGCSFPPGRVRRDTHPSLKKCCARHRARILTVSRGIGNDVGLATRRINALAKAGLSGETDVRKILAVYEREGLLVPSAVKTSPVLRVAAPAPEPSPTPRVVKVSPAAAPDVSPTHRGGHVGRTPKPSDARDTIEQLLRDHELVEIIGREVVTALAARVKGGAA